MVQESTGIRETTQGDRTGQAKPSGQTKSGQIQSEQTRSRRTKSEQTKSGQTKSGRTKADGEKGKRKAGQTGEKVIRKVTRVPLKVAVYIVALILLAVAAYRSYLFGKAVFSEEGTDPSPGYTQTVEVEPNMGAWEIGSMLEEQALIDSKWVFLVQSFIFELDISEDTAGSYRVNSSQSGEDIIKMFNSLDKVE